MSKSCKGKICVYCCAAVSITTDHVFARKLLLEPRRKNLPKIPSCEKCNSSKSKLEHYLAMVLPFGGRHGDALLNLRSMVPKRLTKNPRLHASLHNSFVDPTQRVWTREGGLLVRSTATPFDWNQFEQWIVFVIKGLTWYHWKVLIALDCVINVFLLTSHNEAIFQRLLGLDAAERVFGDVGAGTFSYTAVQGKDSPMVRYGKSQSMAE